MKKRLWSILLVACMVLTLLPFGAFAADDGSVVWSTSASDTVLMVSCDGAMPNYTTARPAEWAKLKDTVKTVIVQDNVTAIGNNAFSGFTKLENVSISKSVTTVGEGAFKGCTALTSVALPGAVNINDDAFNGCTNLEKVTVTTALKFVRQNAFKGAGVKDVYFNGNNTQWNLVKTNAEKGNDPLFDADKHVICDKHSAELQNVLKATCTEKGYSGDEVCKVCGTVISVGEEVPALKHDWLKWKVVTKVTETQEGLEQRICYNDNDHVQKVQIPAGTVYEPAKAELLNEATTSITVPNTRGNIIWLKWISEDMPAAKEETENPFSDVKDTDVCYDAVLWAIDEGIITKAQVESKKLSPNEMLTAEKVAEIAGEGTLPTSGYEKDFPHTVTYKTTANEWVIPAPTEASDADFVYVISSDGKSVSIKSYKGNAEKVVIPEKLGNVPIVGIRDKAFQNKTKMTEVTIPATVTSIGADAFNGCSKLASVTIPDAVTSIGARAFKGCAALTTVTVPEGVTSIGNEAFAGCDKMTSISLPKSLKTLGADALPTKAALKDVYFQSGEQDWTNLKYTVEKGVTVHYAEDASPLTWEPTADGKGIKITGCQNVAADVVIPATLDGLPVTEIDSDAFKGKNKITSVSIPEGVTAIEPYTFSDCTALKSVTLPKSLVKVDNYAFDGTKVKDVYYGGTLQDWNDLVFIKAGNDPLEKATIHPADCVEHQTELKNEVKATCTEKGYSGDKVCKVCGKTIEEGKEVAALGHDWGEWEVTKAPTETEKGEETRVCKRDATHVEKQDVEPTGKPDVKPVSFIDVKTGDYFAEPVAWAVNHTPVITNGIDALHFAPDMACTRAQMVTFLYRAAGEPVVTNTTNPFVDVPANEYYTKAVLWAVQEKITTGTSDTTFSPDATVTRAQTVTFLWRMAGQTQATSAVNPFVDVPAGEYYANAVLWAVQEKVTTGIDAQHFAPDMACTRAQIVTMMYRDPAITK